MILSELARAAAGLDDAAFARKYPHAALIFVTRFEAPSKEAPKVDTPGRGIVAAAVFGKATGSFGSTTDSFPALEDLGNTPSPDHPPPGTELRGSAPVVFLEKSKRNPFASMITIGRAPNNDVCVPLPTISKVHAYLVESGGAWKLYDQNATNGTFLDQQRLAANGSAALVDGARVGFGPEAKARFFTPVGLHGFLALFRAGVAV